MVHCIYIIIMKGLLFFAHAASSGQADPLRGVPEDLLPPGDEGTV